MKAFVLAAVLAPMPLLSAQAPVSAALEGVGFDQHLGEFVPLDLAFTDEAGRSVTLKQYAGRKPFVLNLVYYQCPSLCSEAINGLLRAMRAMGRFSLGTDYNVVTLSFNPREKPALAAKKGELYRHGYERPASPSSWPFLTGERSAIDALTKAVGFRYRYDPTIDQYAHTAGVVVVTPNGRISRYLFGVEYSAKDLRLALTEASEGKIGGLVEQVLLYCFRYDPATGRYSLAVIRVMRAAGALMALGMASAIFLMLRRERYA